VEQHPESEETHPGALEGGFEIFGFLEPLEWAPNGVSSNAKRVSTPETANGCTRGAKLWRAQPQERIRYEIGPTGSGRIKAPGGCENLKVQAVGRGKPDQ
jgi:hypothetical protein